MENVTKKCNYGKCTHYFCVMKLRAKLTIVKHIMCLRKHMDVSSQMQIKMLYAYIKVFTSNQGGRSWKISLKSYPIIIQITAQITNLCRTQLCLLRFNKRVHVISNCGSMYQKLNLKVVHLRKKKVSYMLQYICCFCLVHSNIILNIPMTLALTIANKEASN